MQDWLVSGCMGRAESLRMALDELGLIPTAGVAVPVQAFPSSSSYVAVPLGDAAAPAGGVVFAYLPLPQRSGLPVHVNAAFAVSADRRSLAEPSDDDKAESRDARWNGALLRDAVTSAYVRLLGDLAALSPASRPVQLYLLWPRSDHVAAGCLADLPTSFYRALGGAYDGGQQPALFSDGRRWATVSDSVRNDDLVTYLFSYLLTAYLQLSSIVPSVL